MPKILLFENIAERLMKDYSNRDALPSERELSAKYACNRRTVRAALAFLAEKGILDSQSRNGHFLRTNGATEPESPRPRPSRRPIILLLSMNDRFYDPAHNCMVGGAIHQAQLANITLVVREVMPEALNSPNRRLEDFTGGLEPDGYFLAGTAPLALHELVQKTMKPCVMLGRFYEESRGKRQVRCKQILTDLSRIYREIGEHLAALGHRRVLCAAPWFGHSETADALAAGLGPEVQFDTAHEWPENGILTPMFKKQAAQRALEKLDGHTALVVPHGHIYGLEIIHGLQQAGLRWPDDLSLIFAEAETDWYMDTFGVSSVYSEVREQGVACIRELCRQIENGRLEYGFGYTPISYVERHSVGKPKHHG